MMSSGFGAFVSRIGDHVIWSHDVFLAPNTTLLNETKLTGDVIIEQDGRRVEAKYDDKIAIRGR